MFCGTRVIRKLIFYPPVIRLVSYDTNKTQETKIRIGVAHFMLLLFSLQIAKHAQFHTQSSEDSDIKLVELNAEKWQQNISFERLHSVIWHMLLSGVALKKPGHLNR